MMFKRLDQARSLMRRPDQDQRRHVGMTIGDMPEIDCEPEDKARAAVAGYPPFFSTSRKCVIVLVNGVHATMRSYSDD